MSQESDQLPKVDSEGQQESVSQMDIEKMFEGVSNAMIAELKCESDRHNQSMTTVLTTAFKKLAITIQNRNVFKVDTPETDELNQNYSQNVHKKVTPVTDELNQNYSQNEAGKAYYDTSGKRGLLCILLLASDCETANKEDEDVLREFFEKTLGFDVETYNSYDVLDKKIKSMDGLTADNYYCLLICISGHGFENMVITKSETWKTSEGLTKRTISELKTTDSIKHRFSNESIKTLAGVPKIVILDTCRGSKENFTIELQDSETKKKTLPDYLPTTDSDCIIIHATTLGKVSFIPDNGSVGIQGVMKALNANWKTDHLEEILIDARRAVAMFHETVEMVQLRQTLETQSTLTKRLMFVKSKR